MKKLIVVTGASSGFGKEIALQLSKKGYPLLLIARRIEKLKDMNLPNCLCKKVDVRSLKDFSQAIEEAEQTYGKVDCLINNAGIMLLGEIDTQDPQEWEIMFDVNVKGVLNGMKTVIPNMKKQQTGTIINISSLAGEKTYEYHSTYSGTKFAVHGISETARWELAPHNIRVITISPGAAETELINHITQDSIKQDYIDWKQEIGGAISANEVAAAVVFSYELPQNVCIRDLKIAPTKQQN